MFNSHIKRMDSYRDFLPLTPNNYKLNYKSHNKKGNIRGGALNDVSESNLWVNPIPDAYKGIPSYLFTHPNKYSSGKSQVMLYDTYANFLDTTFYSKYKEQFKVITQPPRFARTGYSNNWFDYIVINYGQKWRIIFTQAEKGALISTDFTSVYLDVINMDGYVAALSEIYKDRDVISPLEANAINRIARNADIAQDKYETYNTTYDTGHTDGVNYQKNADEEAQQEAEAQKDDSSSDDIWGSISTGLEIAAMFI